MRQKHTQGPYHGFSWNLGGLIHLWVGLTTPNIFGLGLPLWAGQPYPGSDFTSNVQTFTYRSDNPEMKNFLYISKDINGKFWISARARHFLKGSLSKKKFWDFGFLVSDPFKKWSEDPQIENLQLSYLPIYRKFFISGLSDHFLEGSLTKKPKSQNLFYSYDPFKKWFYNPKIENFPLMFLLIYHLVSRMKSTMSWPYLMIDIYWVISHIFISQTD